MDVTQWCTAIWESRIMDCLGCGSSIPNAHKKIVDSSFTSAHKNNWFSSSPNSKLSKLRLSPHCVKSTSIFSLYLCLLPSSIPLFVFFHMFRELKSRYIYFLFPSNWGSFKMPRYSAKLLKTLNLSSINYQSFKP